MGIGNWETPAVSGELDFLTRFAKHIPGSVVIDVGANIGNYSGLMKRLDPSSTIYAFQPHPETFKELEVLSKNLNFHALSFAIGEKRRNW